HRDLPSFPTRRSSDLSSSWRICAFAAPQVVGRNGGLAEDRPATVGKPIQTSTRREKRELAEAGTARPERGLEHDLDRLRRDRSRQPREDAEFGALVLVRQLVPPRQPIELAHVYVRGRRLWKLVTDRAEQIEAVRHDPRRVPQLAASDLEDRLPRSARARGEMPAAGVGSAHPDGEIAVEGKD